MRSFDLAPQRKPFARFKIFLRFFNAIVAFFTLGMFYFVGRKRLSSFFGIRKLTRPFWRSCFALRTFALKWFCPGIRARTFPVRVTLRRFRNDLLVFGIFYFFSTSTCMPRGPCLGPSLIL